MSEPSPPSPPSRVLVTGVVVFYLVAALSLVMANKWVLNATETPIFFTMVQFVIAVLLFLLSDLLRLLPDRLTFEIEVCKGLVPMVALSVLAVCFSNYTLKYVDASFYQVARGLVLPFTVLTSFLFLHARPSPLILTACSIVTFGFLTGVLFDGAPLSPVGIAFGVASSAITAVHSVVIKRSLEVVKESALALSWYSNLLSTGVLALLVVLTGELPAVHRMLFEDGVESSAQGGRISPLHTFLVGSAITGVLGFLMSIASLLSIKVTSPITHMVSSAVRGVASSLLGMWLFHDVITSGRASSIAIILGGSIYYTRIKHIESLSKKEYERVQMEDVEVGQKAGERSS